ncbi:MAG: amidohydrolase [Gammaproteobacteria bacterium]|nr:amidohydrolase [Gammaproteobacteria bacterium]
MSKPPPLKAAPFRTLAALCLVWVGTGCSKLPESADRAPDTVYFNGDIITMNDRLPTVEAVAVTDGKISWVGDVEAVAAAGGGHTRWVDLQGNTLMPGFFDSHSHLALTAAKLAAVNTDPPPAGPADSIASIQRLLRERLSNQPPAPGDWLVGWGYDHAMLAEGRHPTRTDLDAVSAEVPIMLIHFSSHQIVVNSAGLERSGITAQTQDPQGGRILRAPDGLEPNGILQENAMYPVALPILNALMTGGADTAAGDPPTESALQRMDDALQEYASRGFTTVTEMGATQLSINVLREMSRQRRLTLDVVATGISKAFTVEQIAALYSAGYRDRLRVGGLKIVLDGGSPGRSAYLSAPYHRQLSSEQGYRGFPQFEDASELNDLVASSYRAHVPVYIHALGDAAVEQATATIEHAHAAAPGEDRRTQLIHVQQAREEQLDKIAEIGATITFQVAHNYYFGDFHEKFIYGPRRTARLNPARSALDRGISVSIHHDSPVHPVDQMMLIWATVNRVTRSGRVIGHEQRIDVMDALKASTINAAFQFFEDDVKGSIEPGKSADLVVLSSNPLKVDPLAIKDIQIIETIKDGASIYRKQ